MVGNLYSGTCVSGGGEGKKKILKEKKTKGMGRREERVQALWGGGERSRFNAYPIRGGYANGNYLKRWGKGDPGVGGGGEGKGKIVERGKLNYVVGKC